MNSTTTCAGTPSNDAADQLPPRTADADPTAGTTAAWWTVAGGPRRAAHLTGEYLAHLVADRTLTDGTVRRALAVGTLDDLLATLLDIRTRLRSGHRMPAEAFEHVIAAHNEHDTSLILRGRICARVEAAYTWMS